jgi:hypothetical protein
MPVISALRMQRQEDCKFEASLGYIARLYLKKQKQNNRKTKLNKNPNQKQKKKERKKKEMVA